MLPDVWMCSQYGHRAASHEPNTCAVCREDVGIPNGSDVWMCAVYGHRTTQHSPDACVLCHEELDASCTRCGERGGTTVLSSWHEDETGPQDEIACSMCAESTVTGDTADAA